MGLYGQDILCDTREMALAVVIRGPVRWRGRHETEEVVVMLKVLTDWLTGRARKRADLEADVRLWMTRSEFHRITERPLVAGRK